MKLHCMCGLVCSLPQGNVGGCSRGLVMCIILLIELFKRDAGRTACAKCICFIYVVYLISLFCSVDVP